MHEHRPNKHQLNRRDFLKGAATAGIATGVSAGCASRPDVAEAAKASDTSSASEWLSKSGTGDRVAVQALPVYSTAAEVEASARELVEELGGLGWLGRGDRVLLKPASNSANRYPATTRPELVTAIARILRAEGAGEVVMADHPGVATVHHTRKSTKGSTRDTFTENGLLEAALKADCAVHGFEEPGYDGFVASETAHAKHWRGPLMIPRIVTEVDHIVYLNRVSTHVLGGSTLALKNAVGWLREDSRLELHRDADSFLEKCAEINAAPEIADRTRLVISDATEIQTTIGPDFGYAARLDPPLLVGSTNIALHDVACYGLLSYAREELTPWWAHATDPYPLNSSWMNRAFVAMSWGVDEARAYKGYDAPARERAVHNRIIRRGVEIFSAVSARPDYAFMAELSRPVRKALVEA